MDLDSFNLVWLREEQELNFQQILMAEVMYLVVLDIRETFI